MVEAAKIFGILIEEPKYIEIPDEDASEKNGAGYLDWINELITQ
jgi:hypothetical protein